MEEGQLKLPEIPNLTLNMAEVEAFEAQLDSYLVEQENILKAGVNFNNYYSLQDIVKGMKGFEDNLEEGKGRINLGDVNRVLSAIDKVKAKTRENRLFLDKQIKNLPEAIKEEAVNIFNREVSDIPSFKYFNFLEIVTPLRDNILMELKGKKLDVLNAIYEEVATKAVNSLKMSLTAAKVLNDELIKIEDESFLRLTLNALRSQYLVKVLIDPISFCKANEEEYLAIKRAAEVEAERQREEASKKALEPSKQEAIKEEAVVVSSVNPTAGVIASKAPENNNQVLIMTSASIWLEMRKLLGNNGFGDSYKVIKINEHNFKVESK